LVQNEGLGDELYGASTGSSITPSYGIILKMRGLTSYVCKKPHDIASLIMNSRVWNFVISSIGAGHRLMDVMRYAPSGTSL
jgi:hypothetical protein